MRGGERPHTHPSGAEGGAGEWGEDTSPTMLLTKLMHLTVSKDRKQMAKMIVEATATNANIRATMFLSPDVPMAHLLVLSQLVSATFSGLRRSGNASCADTTTARLGKRCVLVKDYRAARLLTATTTSRTRR